MTVILRMRAGCVFTLVGAIAGCAGPPAGPTTVPGSAASASTKGLAAQAALTVLSGETGLPIAGAKVIVGGREATTDDAGRIDVPDGIGPEALVDLLAEGYFDRQTQLRLAAPGGLFSLWPRSSPTGLTEAFTSRLVYTASSASAEVGATPLWRWAGGVTDVEVILGPGFDPSLGQSVDFQVDAVHETNAVLDGGVVYREPVYGDATDENGTVLLKIDPDDPACEGSVFAFARWKPNSRREIRRAEIGYCGVNATQEYSTVLHEFGHTVGLFHSDSEDDLMYGYTNDTTDFREREALAVRLMYQRRAGNRFPDNERAALGNLSLVERTIACRH